MCKSSSNEFFIHPTSIVEEGVSIGRGTKIWHFCHVMPEVSIGEYCIIGQNVFIGRRVKIGNKVKVQNNVSIYEGVIIEDEVFVGPSVVFTNVKYPRAFIEQKHNFLTTYIERGATLGANATIVCGVRIGAYAFVGAGAVVTKNVLPFALVVGNPAKQVGWVSHAGRPLQWQSSTKAVCPLTNRTYLLINGRLIPEEG